MNQLCGILIKCHCNVTFLLYLLSSAAMREVKTITSRVLIILARLLIEIVNRLTRYLRFKKATFDYMVYIYRMCNVFLFLQ